MKPEDKAALRKLERAAGQGEDEPEAPAKKKGGLPASLIAELTSHKAVAAQLTMASNPKVALLAVTHALALQQLYPYAVNTHSALQITARSPVFSMAIRETVKKSPAAKKLAALVKGWQRKLPKKPEDLWNWLTKQTPATVQGLLAVCAATTLDMVQANGAEATPASNELASAIRLDMADHWTVTAENYFTRVPRKHLLEELGNDIKPNTRKQVEGMKRDAAAKALVAELKGKRWLPPVLRNEKPGVS